MQSNKNINRSPFRRYYTINSHLIFFVNTGKKTAKKGGGGGSKKQKGLQRATSASSTQGGGIGGRGGNGDDFEKVVMSALTGVTAQLTTIGTKFSDMEERLTSVERGKRTNGANSDDDSISGSSSVQYIGSKKAPPGKKRPVGASSQFELFQRTGWSGPIDGKSQKGPWKGQMELDRIVEAQKKVVKELTIKLAREKEEQEKR